MNIRQTIINKVEIQKLLDLISILWFPFQQNVPLKTVGDGNCLYRTISRYTTATEISENS